jgi:hypothetical protein
MIGWIDKKIKREERLAEIERKDLIHARNLRPRVPSRHTEERYQRPVGVFVREIISSHACIYPIHVSMHRFRESVKSKVAHVRRVRARASEDGSSKLARIGARGVQSHRRQGLKLPVEDGKGFRRLNSEEVGADDGDCRAL